MNATYSTFSTPVARRVDLGLTVLRIVLGIIFLAHGSQKLFVFGLGGVTGAFTRMGVPLATVTAPLVAAVEFLGGLVLIVGLFTRVAALLLAIDMLGAILLVKLKGGFFGGNGFEYELSLLAASAALTFAGPGAFALDNVFMGRRARAIDARIA